MLCALFNPTYRSVFCGALVSSVVSRLCNNFHRTFKAKSFVVSKLCPCRDLPLSFPKKKIPCKWNPCTMSSRDVSALTKPVPWMILASAALHKSISKYSILIFSSFLFSAVEISCLKIFFSKTFRWWRTLISIWHRRVNCLAMSHGFFSPLRQPFLTSAERTAGYSLLWLIRRTHPI